MTDSRDDDARLTVLLQAIAPEPRPDFLAGARRRYLEAIEARDRREAVAGVLAASLALGLAATVLLSAFDAVELIGGIATAMASLAKWMDGIGIVLSQVPPLAWTSAVLVSVVSLLSAVSLRRVRSPVTLK